ncbi:MAG: hypothetical protein AB1422_17675 [bacterium]
MQEKLLGTSSEEVSVQPQRHRVHRELRKLATNGYELTSDIR